MKKIIITVIVIIGVLFVAGITKDKMIQSVITGMVKKATGAEVRMDKFSLGLFSQSVRISGFKMYNPQGFSNNVLLDLPTIHISYDLAALLKKKVHMPRAEITLKELTLEKNKEGKMNVDALAVSTKEEKKKEESSSEQMPLQIDFLKLDIGAIVVKDYSAGKEPTVKKYEINIHKNYKNITSVQQLAVLILTESMKSAGIKGAQIYGVAALAGVGILPVAAAGTLLGKDYARQDFNASPDELYRVSVEVLGNMGKVTVENREAGTVSAVVNSAQVYVRIKKKENNKTEATVSARKYLLPKPEIAGGVLYEISKKIK